MEEGETFATFPLILAGKDVKQQKATSPALSYHGGYKKPLHRPC